MPRLIWVFAGRTCHFVGFIMRRLIYFGKCIATNAASINNDYWTFCVKVLISIVCPKSIRNFTFCAFQTHDRFVQPCIAICMYEREKYGSIAFSWGNMHLWSKSSTCQPCQNESFARVPLLCIRGRCAFAMTQKQKHLHSFQYELQYFFTILGEHGCILCI